MEVINSGIQPKQNSTLLSHVFANYGGDEEKKKWAHHWICEGLRVLEEMLKEQLANFVLVMKSRLLIAVSFRKCTMHVDSVLL